MHYLARAELGFWQEEVFISLYRAGQLMEQLGYPDQAIIDTYLRATDAQPTRVEALYRASLLCRQRARPEEGYRLAGRGLGVPLPADALFVEPMVYDYGLRDEYAVNAYWSGHYRECLDASLELLATATLAPGDLRRVIGNARLAAERLPPSPELGTLGAESLAAQHGLVPPRKLRSRLRGTPRVMLAIMAGEQERWLPLYLDCIEALDYPKSAIVLDIRTVAGTDRTEQLLRDWAGRVGRSYAGVHFPRPDSAACAKTLGHQATTAARSTSTAQLRNGSLRRTLAEDCDFYFTMDVGSFARPCVLRELIALDLSIVAPFLRSIDPTDAFSNYHAEVDRNGYYAECDQY